MDALKKFFPLSFKYSDTSSNLVIGIIIYIIGAIIGGTLIAVAFALIAPIPVVGGIVCALLSAVGSLIDLYVIAGIVIQVLVYTKVLKD